MRVRERYLLGFCFAAGFALTAGIPLWRARDFGETPARVTAPARAAAAATRFSPVQELIMPPTGAALVPPDPARAAPSQADAQPPGDYTSGAASTEDLTVDSPERLDAAARRFARRGAAERRGH